MRDDFIKSMKEILSKRVGLLCSNPKCRRLTIGPNSQESQTTNIGVAAHITAASPGGPRYDEKIDSAERSSIKNGIWLCQSCAKLIDSDESKYTVNLLNKWKNTAEEYAESQLNERSVLKDKYSRILEQIPKLSNEMTKDLNNDPLAREFVLLRKGWVYNDKKGILAYYYEDHDNLDKKIGVLENVGLVNDITYNNTQRYVFTEEFVDILTK